MYPKTKPGRKLYDEIAGQLERARGRKADAEKRYGTASPAYFISVGEVMGLEDALMYAKLGIVQAEIAAALDHQDVRDAYYDDYIGEAIRV